MSKFSLVVVITAFIILQNPVFAQIDTTRKEFFPLQIGNVWQYQSALGDLYTMTVTNDTVLDGYKYYLLDGGGLRSLYPVVRIDSLMQIQGRRGAPTAGDSCGGNTPYEVNAYRLSEPDSMYWWLCEPFWALTTEQFVRFNGVDTIRVFGQPRETLVFDFGGPTGLPEDTLWARGARFVRGIGLVEEWIYDFETFVVLQGAIIDGVRYGNIVSVDSHSNNVPDAPALFQNYPNPFNATTNIKYWISASSFVSLKVFDQIGREIMVLVNQYQIAGEHIIPFNASGLPSGKYYYSIKIDNFQISKTMTIIK